MFAYCLTVTGASDEQAERMDAQSSTIRSLGWCSTPVALFPAVTGTSRSGTSRDQAMSFHDTHVRQALSEAGLDRSRLDVQITEIEQVTTLVAGHGATMPTLAEID